MAPVTSRDLLTIRDQKKDYGFTDVIGIVEGIDQYPGKSYIILNLMDESCTGFRVWFWDHFQRDLDQIEDGSVIQIRNLVFSRDLNGVKRFKACNRTTFATAEIPPSRVEQLKKFILSSSGLKSVSDILGLRGIVGEGGHKCFDVLGRLAIIDGDEFTYLGCLKCSRRQSIDKTGQPICAHCQPSVSDQKAYYKLKVTLKDSSGSVAAWFPRLYLENSLGTAEEFSRLPLDEQKSKLQLLLEGQFRVRGRVSSSGTSFYRVTRFGQVSDDADLSDIFDDVYECSENIQPKFPTSNSNEKAAAQANDTIFEDMDDDWEGNCSKVSMDVSRIVAAPSNEDEDWDMPIDISAVDDEKDDDDMPKHARRKITSSELSDSESASEQDKDGDPEPQGDSGASSDSDDSFVDRSEIDPEAGAKARRILRNKVLPRLLRRSPVQQDVFDQSYLDGGRRSTDYEEPSSSDEGSFTASCTESERARLKQLAEAKSFTIGDCTLAECQDFYLPAKILMKEAILGRYICEYLHSEESVSLGESKLFRPSQFLRPGDPVYLTRLPGEARFNDANRFVPGKILSVVRSGIFRVELERSIREVLFRDLAVDRDDTHYSINFPQDSILGAESGLDPSDESRGSGTDDERMDLGGDTDGSEEIPELPRRMKTVRKHGSVSPEDVRTKFKEADKVFAKWKGDGYFYFATIESPCADSCLYKILFRDGEKALVDERSILPLESVVQVGNSVNSLVDRASGKATIKQVTGSGGDLILYLEVLTGSGGTPKKVERHLLEQIVLSSDQAQMLL